MISSFVLQKRCPNCNKMFGLKTYANGVQEYPSNFKKRKFCSIRCAGVAGEAARKVKAAEKSA